MQKSDMTVKLRVGKDGWVTCPYCRRNHRLRRVLPDSYGRNIEDYCRVCKRRVLLNIDEGQRVELRSQ